MVPMPIMWRTVKIPTPAKVATMICKTMKQLCEKQLCEGSSHSSLRRRAGINRPRQQSLKAVRYSPFVISDGKVSATHLPMWRRWPYSPEPL